MTQPDSKSSPPPAGKKPGNGAPKTVLKLAPRRRNPLLTSSGNIARVLPTLMLVVPLTLLIWFWAEREQNLPQRGVTCPIKLVQGSANRILTLVDPPRITFDLIGPRAGVDRAIAAINGIPPGIEIRLLHELPVRAQPQPVNTLELIQDIDIFKNAGVTVSNPSPAYLSIEVDDTDTRELPVELEKPRDNVSATFEPAHVKVRGPRRVLDKGQVRVVADPTTPSAPGAYDVPNVSVAVLLRDNVRDDRITIEPRTVSAHVEVRLADVKGELKSVPVFLDGTKSTFDKYEVKFRSDPLLYNVNVLGPEATVREMTRPDVVPYWKAILEIDPRTDLTNEGEWRSKRVKFDLPPGVTPAKEEQNRQVEFRLVDRGAAGN